MQHSGDMATQPGSTTSTIAQAGFDRSILYTIISFSYRIYRNFSFIFITDAELQHNSNLGSSLYNTFICLIILNENRNTI